MRSSGDERNVLAIPATEDAEDAASCALSPTNCKLRRTPVSKAQPSAPAGSLPTGDSHPTEDRLGTKTGVSVVGMGNRRGASDRAEGASGALVALGRFGITAGAVAQALIASTLSIDRR